MAAKDYFMPEILTPLYEGDFDQVRDDEQARRYVVALLGGDRSELREDAGGVGGDGVWVPFFLERRQRRVAGGGGKGLWRDIRGADGEAEEELAGDFARGGCGWTAVCEGECVRVRLRRWSISMGGLRRWRGSAAASCRWIGGRVRLTDYEDGSKVTMAPPSSLIVMGLLSGRLIVLLPRTTPDWETKST